LPPLLVLVPVRRRRPRLDGAETVDRAGLEEHRLHERGLARPAVADDGDVADLPGLLGHTSLLLFGGHTIATHPRPVGQAEWRPAMRARWRGAGASEGAGSPSCGAGRRGTP